MTIEIRNFKRWIIGAGIFNIVAALPLSLPFTVKSYYSMFNSINSKLNLGGKSMMLPEEGVNLLWVNTCGLALLLVGMMLIYASGNINERVGIPLLNSIVRIIFVFLLSYYVVTENIAKILISVAIIDAVISIVFLYYIYRFYSKRTK